MKKRWIFFALFVCLGCRKQYDVQLPDTAWQQFQSPAAQPLTSANRSKLEGVYAIGDGSIDFGNLTAARWSYTAEGQDTVFHLSFFCEKDVSYFICEGRRLDSVILLNGYWRKMASTEAGKVHLIVPANQGAAYVLDSSSIESPSINISGLYGRGNDDPSIRISLTYARALYHGQPMELVVHRGGGQTADLLPASENS